MSNADIISVTINGEIHQLTPMTISQMLENVLSLKGKPVVVELNQQALLPKQHATTILQHGDKIELVVIAAGG